jgi:hypothetical protein
MQDVVGLLRILFPTALQTIESDQTSADWYQKIVLKGNDFEFFNELDGFKHTDTRRLAAIDPEIISALIRTGDHALIAKYYHHMEELVVLRRSTASLLPVDGRGKTISLAGMLTKHYTNTVNLEYKADEEVESQWRHRDNCR